MNTMPIRSTRARTFVLLISAALAGCSSSEIPPQEPQPDSPELAMARRALLEVRQRRYEGANLERGMSVAIGTAPCLNSAPCFSCYQCHGVRGAGSEAAGIPRLTGQPYGYLLKSLDDFAFGRRPYLGMQSVAAGLSEQQRRDVAAYYAAMTEISSAAAHARTNADPESDRMEAGATIAHEGSADGRILACAHCHGTAGIGRPPAYPYLAGQHRIYLERQLRLFRADQRSGTELQIMEELARRMSDEQIAAVAQYFSSLRPPTDKVTEKLVARHRSSALAHTDGPHP